LTRRERHDVLLGRGGEVLFDKICRRNGIAPRVAT
jgi:hypothetical protein